MNAEQRLADLEHRVTVLDGLLAPTNDPRDRCSYLTVNQHFNLNHACRMLTACDFHAYQVGSSLERADWRDVDLRCILTDEEYDTLIAGNEHRLKFLNTVISDWLSARSDLPIDFQFQRMTEANEEFNGRRNYIGVPIAFPQTRAAVGGQQ